MTRLVDMTDQRFGSRVVVERAPGRRPKNGTLVTQWRVRCDCGREAVVSATNLRRGDRCKCSLRTAEDPGYIVIHQRHQRDRGKAATHLCADCGNPAADWAYGGCPDGDERTDSVGGYLLAYCPHPGHYDPLCRRCHVARDRVSLAV